MAKVLPNLRTTGKLYWGYGSNLNKEHMVHRCPGARVVAPLWLPSARLVFRSVADVIHDDDPDARCPGGLWRITENDEVMLDCYEGVSHGLYRKHYILLRVNGRAESCLLYTMRSTGIAPPSESYLGTIVQGYRDFNLPLDYLDRAVEESWAEKRINADIRRRRARSSHGPVAYGVDPDALAS